MRIAIVGNGKMGAAVAALARERGHTIVTTVGGAENAGGQALTPERFQHLMRRLPGVLHAVDRHLWMPELPAHVVGAR